MHFLRLSNRGAFGFLFAAVFLGLGFLAFSSLSEKEPPVRASRTSSLTVGDPSAEEDVFVGREPRQLPPKPELLADLSFGLIEERWERLPEGRVVRRIALWEDANGARRRSVQLLETRRDAGYRKWVLRSETTMAAGRFVVARKGDSVSWRALQTEAAARGWRVSRTSSRSHVARLSWKGVEDYDLDVIERAKAELEATLGEDFLLGWSVLFQPALVPDDTKYPDQWSWPHLGAPEVWAETTGSNELVVAVIDSGIDLDHPELVGNIWRNPHESADGTDTAGTGFVDDVRGWNFAEGNNRVDDPDGHGTGVAGIIGAAGNNGFGIAGGAWAVRLMPLRVGQGEIAVENIIDAIDYAVERRIRNDGKVVAINLSLGARIPGQTADQETPLYLALKRARDAGIVCVAAAGNDGIDNDALVGGEPNHYFPSDFDLDHILSVAASTETDSLKSSSNFGTESVDLAAPGSAILTTDKGGGLQTRNGTSLAAPHVTGLLILAAAHNPDLHAGALRRIVLEGGHFTAAFEGKLSRPVRLAYDKGFTETRRWPRIRPTPEWEELPYLRQSDTRPLPVRIETSDNAVTGVGFEIGDQTLEAEEQGANVWSVAWDPAATGNYSWTVDARSNGGRNIRSDRDSIRVLAPFPFWQAEQFGADFEAEAAAYEADKQESEPTLGERFFFGLGLDGPAGPSSSDIPSGALFAETSRETNSIRLRFWQAEQALSIPVTVEKTDNLDSGNWAPISNSSTTTLETDATSKRVLREIATDIGEASRTFYRLRFHLDP